MPRWTLLALSFFLLFGPMVACQRDAASRDMRGGSVIFVHPDGASSATWAAARALHVGPDADLNWDTLPAIAVYRGHLADSLTASSHGGATTHATGVRVQAGGFGRYSSGPDSELVVDASGRPLSVGLQAIEAGYGVGLVQTGIAPEPGTACFVTDAPRRNDYEAIVADLVHSGCHVIMSGGERHFLPKGKPGRHGIGERSDGRDLIAEARAKGYTVVFTRDELMQVPAGTTRLLGVFAFDATFNAAPEEALADRGLPLYEPGTPTIGEMTEVALQVLDSVGKRFLLVVEEEATDNFGNANNASGVLEAAKRADEAIGLAQRYVEANPRTLLLTCADSDGGGLRMKGMVYRPDRPLPQRVPSQETNGAPIDGVNGAKSAPFLAAPDKAGVRLPFMVVWPTLNDVSGGVLVRAQGLNSDRVSGTIDNTEIAELMRGTLFGR